LPAFFGDGLCVSGVISSGAVARAIAQSFGSSDIEAAAAVVVAGNAAPGDQRFGVEDAFREVGETVLQEAGVGGGNGARCDRAGCVDVHLIVAVEVEGATGWSGLTEEAGECNIAANCAA